MLAILRRMCYNISNERMIFDNKRALLAPTNITNHQIRRAGGLLPPKLTDKHCSYLRLNIEKSVGAAPRKTKIQNLKINSYVKEYKNGRKTQKLCL